jgi:hypothetical protein
VLCFVVAIVVILFPLAYALSRENVTLSVTLFFQATTVQSRNETSGTTKRTSGAPFWLKIIQGC